MTKEKLFTRYESFVIAVLAFIQFTVILDFMVLSPLGNIVMPALQMSPAQFSRVVAGYAISAGISGLVTASFADKFDRKKMLLFFYVGFVIGTALCALATDYTSLLLARIVTGIFGGVISSITYAIITDLFRLEVRGRVMGFVQMAFAASQALGIPAGLKLATMFEWHVPFTMIVGISIVAGIIIALYLKPVADHLQERARVNAFRHLVSTLQKPHYLRTFAATTLLATGGFMLMPFGTEFMEHNLKIDKEIIYLVYIFTGICTIITGPLIGKFSDSVGKYPVFVAGSILSIIMAIVYCNLGITPLWVVTILSMVMFVGVSSRMISSSALISAVPVPADRGAFMSINSAVQYIAGGIAAVIAGQIIVKRPDGYLEHYNRLGYAVTISMLITIALMYLVHRYVQRNSSKTEGKPVVNAESEVSVAATK
ncbi:MFS transporter [Dawidia soli]|uniref:MFS transporter n=1 Tax=Dawidia soli TaxID=2782352 RepID=A0AAP2DBH9_9BACT|nr:MFS transporter [Dawidia soli]MBT1687865.1 MFS transporter [Dawidia soli]